MVRPLLMFCWLAALPLGTELHEEGFSFRPPADFRLERMDFYRNSEVGVLGFPAPGGQLIAALIDRDGPDAAALLISQADGSFDAHPAARDELSGAVVRHFRDELGMPLALETARAVGGAAPRIEVLGTLKEEGEIRHALVAVMAGQGRHAVVIFTVPSGRWEALAPVLEQSLDTYRAEAPASTATSRGAVGAVAGALAGALVVSVALWRRRRTRG